MKTFRLLMSIFGIGFMVTAAALWLWVTVWGPEPNVVGVMTAGMLFLSAWPVVLVLGIVGVVLAVDQLFKRRKP